jgi:endonuclease-3
MTKIDWHANLQPLIKKYKGKKHPLDYKNTYQLVVMVILSAQDSDKHINQIAPDFFKAFPDMEALSRADEQALFRYISKVRNFGNKAKWLRTLAATVKKDSKIPMTMEELIKLPGIGRKSANVILRESGKTAEGIVVDLHVVRVAPRLGIASGTDPKKIEKAMMDILPQKDWNETGMAMSFLGREICRPTNPKCPECLLNGSCDYRKKMLSETAQVR